MQRIIIIGPAHPLRGGLASFDERLARAFQQQGDEVSIYTFSLQYPGFLFPGTTQYSDEPAPQDIHIEVAINSVNPINWWQVGNKIKKLKPDIVVVRYWLPFMGPALGTILRRIAKNKNIQIIAITDNVIPHEKRLGDHAFTQYFLKPVHACITMSEKVLQDLRTFTQKPARCVVHPLYDNFGDRIPKDIARAHLQIAVKQPLILFFGFIRKYKGLDILLQAMKILQQQPSTRDIKLLIAGEYYDDEKFYQQIMDELGIRDQLILKTQFISDREVKYYLCAADFVVQPYRNATQSGVTPLAYHFEKPMLVTNVGGLPALVPDYQSGLIAEPNAESIARKIQELFSLGENFFLPHLREEKKKYSWDNIVQAIKGLTA